jgi:hypothetical protein
MVLSIDVADWSQAAKGRVAAEEQLVVLREQGNALEQALAAQTQQTGREEIRAYIQYTELQSSTGCQGSLKPCMTNRTRKHDSTSA